MTKIIQTSITQETLVRCGDIAIERTIHNIIRKAKIEPEAVFVVERLHYEDKVMPPGVKVSLYYDFDKERGHTLMNIAAGLVKRTWRQLLGVEV